MAQNPMDPFNSDMNDIFNQLMGGMNGYNSENRRYMINGREVTPEEFDQYRQTGQLPGGAAPQAGHPGQQPNEGKESILHKLGRNLTEEARQGELDPVIGRNKEIQETAEILSRRTKNNPVLVGDAGVGKTAVVEGLAQAIVHGDVPAPIKDKEIISIDISGLEAGTQYRGSFEENMQKLIDEVKKAGNVILFFDEIHQIIGAGSTGSDSGSKGMADIIKPALSRGEITVIGATTQDEYRNTIMKDAALARRFNPVTVNAPSKADTVAILKGIRDLYERHHNVKLPDDVLQAAVDYSVQYMPQRALPDKAIDLIDMTAAHLAAKHPAHDAKQIEAEIKKEEKKQKDAAAKEDYKAAQAAKDKIADLKKQLSQNSEDEKVTATPEDVANAVEQMTGIPVSKIGASDVERLKDMDKRLEGKVIGQDEAVEAVSRAIRRNRAGFDEGDQPIGSFLFVGPTGVGKTELAKQLAIKLFGKADALVRLDMSEYQDQMAVNKLIGSAPGYVGYGEGGQLTEKIRHQPYSLILLDEIEKANPQVFNALLQIMDDGRLTDAQGRTISFKDTIIIMTSNAGYSDKLLKGDDQDALRKALEVYFRPEFLNRLDAIVPFNSLTSEDMLKILDLYLVKMEKSLAKRNIKLHVTDDAKKYLAKKGYDKEFGARPLRRVVEQDLETPAAKLIVSKPDTKEVKFTIDDKHLYLNGEILEDVLFDKETREQEKKDIKEAEKADKKEEK